MAAVRRIKIPKPNSSKIEFPDAVENSGIVEQKDNKHSAVLGLEGSKLKVTYYRRNVVNQSSRVKYDINKDIATLNYTKLTNVTVYQTTSLSESSTMLSDVLLEYNIELSDTPVEGDVVIVDVNKFGKCLFTVTSIERSSFNVKQPYFHISVSFVANLNQNPDYAEDIESRVTDIFKAKNIHNDLLNVTNKTVVKTREDKVKLLAKLEDGLMKILDNKYTGINLGKYVLLDKNIEYVLFMTFSDTSISKRVMISNNVDKHCIYSYLFNENFNAPSIADDTTVKRKALLLKEAVLNTMNIYNDSNDSTLPYLLKLTPASENLKIIEASNVKPTDVKAVVNKQVSKPIYKTLVGQHIEIDNTYAMNESFYDMDITTMTIFELFIYDILINKTLDEDLLIKIAEDIDSWDNLNKYLYYPMLIIILKNFMYKK